jgi:hypothetical protein
LISLKQKILISFLLKKKLLYYLFPDSLKFLFLPKQNLFLVHFLIYLQKKKALFSNSQIVLDSLSSENKGKLITEIDLQQSLDENEQKDIRTKHFQNLPISTQDKLTGSPEIKKLSKDIKRKLISGIEYDNYNPDEKLPVLSLPCFLKVPHDIVNPLLQGSPFSSLRETDYLSSPTPFNKLTALDKEQILIDFGVVYQFFDEKKEIVFSKILFASYPLPLQKKLQLRSLFSSLSPEGLETLLSGGGISRLSEDDSVSYWKIQQMKVY